MGAAGRIVLVLALTALAAAPARAEDAREAQARSHFAIGQGHYHLGEFAEAIESFQAGYRLKPLPLFLFNIAQAARKSGRYELAMDYYVQYLEREPSRAAPQRTEAESWVLKLRRAAAEGKLRSRAAGAATKGWKDPFADDEPAEPRKPAPAVAKPALTAAPPPPEPVTAPPLTLTAAPERAPAPAPAKRPVWKRGWFWGTLAAVAVVGAGIGVGTWLGLETRSPAPPSLGSVQF